MGRFRLWLVVALAAVITGQVLHAQQTTQILLPVFDDEGTPMTTLGPDDLAMFEDGKPLKILKVEQPKPRQMRVVLAIDNGRPMGDILVHVRAAAKAFFSALPDGVEATLVTTAPQPRVSVKATKDREALLKGVDRITQDSSGGRTIEALQDVADIFRKQPGDYTSVLVVLGSTFSPEIVNQRHVQQAMDYYNSAGTTVHIVFFKPALAGEGDAQLEIGEKVVKATRGRFETIGSYLQLGVLPAIAKDLGQPGADGQLLLTLERPAGATGRLGGLSMSPRDGIKVGRVTRLP
jgi:hypothetical protein